MSSERDEQSMPDLEAVGKTYREAGFDEEPQAHVDAFIRAAAKRASKRNLNDYLPSLAMAATIMLALGLVLRLTVPGRDLVQPTSAPEADEAAATRVQAPGPRQEQAAPLEDSPMPAAQFVPAPEDVAEQILEERAVQLEEVVAPARASAGVAGEDAIVTVAPAQEDMLEPEGVASSVLGRMATPGAVSVPCTANERGAPDLWLACITAQTDAGLIDAARTELELFRTAFADVAIPTTIVDALEP